MSEFRWGILGTGRIAEAFVKDLERASGHSVVAVGSRTLSKATDFKSIAHEAKACGSYEELVAQTPCRAVISGLLGRLEIESVFYRPTDMKLVLSDGVHTHYPNTYIGHGLREQAIEMARVVRSGALESDLMPWAASIEVMESMDEIRAQINLKYPFE